MNGRELIEKIKKLQEKYGEDLEFFAHGPEGVIAQSGFGTAMNWCVATIELTGTEEPPSTTRIKACFVYGLPAHLQGGPLQYPIKSHQIPFHPDLLAPL